MEHCLVSGRLHRLAYRIKLEVAAIPVVDEGRRYVLQRERAAAGRKPLMIGRGRADTIGHLHDRRPIDEQW